MVNIFFIQYAFSATYNYQSSAASVCKSIRSSMVVKIVLSNPGMLFKLLHMHLLPAGMPAG